MSRCKYRCCSSGYHRRAWMHLAYLFSFVCIFVLLPVQGHAQQYDTVSIFRVPVQLDSFVVKTTFDVNAFIDRVKKDTTFYKAFRNMRFVPYSAVNMISVLGKKGRVKASLSSRTRQAIDKHCRTTKVIEEHTTGDFYDAGGNYRYYTAGLYAYLFFAKVPVCNETENVAGALDARGKGTMEKSKYELKQLIFNPGSKVSGIPFMGDRSSVFDKSESEKYDFRISLERYDDTECYVLRITPKPGYKDRTLYNELNTWFRKKDYSIIARDYALSYSTLIYDFDVTMSVRTSSINGKLYPTMISYDGDWHVITRKREHVKFKMTVSY